MKNKIKKSKDEFYKSCELLGGFVKQYYIPYIILMSLVIAFEVVFIIYWAFNVKTYSVRNVSYLVAYLIMTLSSFAGIVFVILSKKDKISQISMSYLLHLYSFFIMFFATLITILDLDNNTDPIVYLTINMTLAGVIVISPIFYTILNLSSLTVILAFNFINHYSYFTGVATYLNFGVFIIMVIIMSFRHYNVRMKEAKNQEYLLKLSYEDHLTGLGNETAYFEEVDNINKILESVDLKYAIMVMDVNNVKRTNDSYGHRFGCHLIVECGYMLPSIFKTSRLFHIGGDEFVAIIIGEDYDNLEKRILDFDSKLIYSNIEFESHNLILSVARGYYVSKPGMTYKEVFQQADDNMYINKKMIKEKYGLSTRERS